MNHITFPLNAESQGASLTDLHAALQLFLVRGIYSIDEQQRHFFVKTLSEERAADKYGESTQKLVSMFQELKQVQVAEVGVVDAVTAVAMNRLLQELLTVRGRVVDAYGRALPNYVVSLSEYDVDGMTAIGSTQSNPEGDFVLDVRLHDALRTNDGTTGLDLVFEILDPNQARQTIVSVMTLSANAEQSVPRLAESEQAPFVVMNVNTDVEVRIVVHAGARLPTEFEKLVAQLLPFMGQTHFADLQEDAQHFQISFLARETGVERAKIEQLREAFQQERAATGVPAWVFFELAAPHIGLAKVAVLAKEALVALLVPLQPVADSSDLGDIAVRLLAFLKERALHIQLSHLQESAGDWIKPVLGSDEQLHSFLDAYVRHEGDTESFWHKMVERPEFQAAVPTIQLNLQLAQFTLNNTGLVEALKRTGVRTTQHLVDIAPATWEALAFEHRAAIPAHIVGDSDEARAKTYARELQSMVELVFPHEVIKKSIHDANALAFLNNNPEFDFTRTPVETYLSEHEQAFVGVERPHEVTGQIRLMQRLYAVTGNSADMHRLSALGFSSAHQISTLTAPDFLRNLGGTIDPGTAADYHARAMEISGITGMIYHQLRDLTYAHSMLATPIVADLRKVKQVVPNWEAMFGSLDTCACAHCQSVYSPAAYFVDLLHILLGQSNGAVKGVARNELFRRRPDLRYTKLSCEHTETLIPYIDLVNEILETYVAQRNVGNDGARLHAEVWTRDTSGFTSSELRANPQHFLPRTPPNLFNPKSDADLASALLKQATFPLTLPFDFDLETARQFLLEQQGSRVAIMQTFGNPSAHAINAERLNLSEREFEILTSKKLVDGTTDAGVHPVSDLWGAATLPVGIDIVATFLDQTDITYDDLRHLLETRFLNRHFPIAMFLHERSATERAAWIAAHPEVVNTVIELAIMDPEQPCNLKTIKLLHLNVTPLSIEELSRFNRFIRLWRKLGCTPAELDGLLTALNATDLTPDVISGLAAVWQVRPLLQLDLESMAVLLGRIPTAGPHSLFARLFLSKAMLQIDPGFTMNLDHRELADTDELLKDHIPGILAAIQTSEDDLRTIATYVSLDFDSAKLTVDNLSLLCGYVVFAKGLRMKLTPLINLLGLIAPRPSLAPHDLLKTHSVITRLQQVGLKVDDVPYLFQDQRIPGHTLPPSADVIGQSAKVLREGLLKINQEHTPIDGRVTAEFLISQLSLLMEPSVASKIDAILDDPEMKDPSSNLLSPTLADRYRTILKDYLTAADMAALKAMTDIPARRATYWGKFQARLLPVLRETFVQQHLIAAFGVDAGVVSMVLNDAGMLQACLGIETDEPANAKAYAEHYVLLHRFTRLVDALTLSAKELVYFQNNPDFGNFDWKTLDFSVWLRLVEYVALRDAVPPAETDWLAVFDSARSGGDLAHIAQAIVAVSGWDRTNVAYFVSRWTTNDFRNEIVLAMLREQIALSQQLGVSIHKLESWARAPINAKQARDIKHTLKSKYDDTAWIEVSAAVHNRLRKQLRDALTAYLLQKPEIKAADISSTNDLYRYFLIDVEMEACMQTSRLKQAIASVQLFVQRCLLNLEAPTVTPNLIDADQWKWMKNYRPWEANRKVFLYPENWIEPELRDNKSPFFKELESELLQAELTNESAEKALMRYLEKLDEVARLDIVGLWEDRDAQEVHVFGRTFGSPPRYFYRKLDQGTQVWTAWEPVPLDIQGNEDGANAGVHLIPMVWNRRLYLFWPVFTEKTDRDAKEEDEFGVTTSHPTGKEPPSGSGAYHEIRLAWSEYRNRGWVPKRVSQSFVKTGTAFTYLAMYEYRFIVDMSSTLTFNIVKGRNGRMTSTGIVLLAGRFRFERNGKVEAENQFRWIHVRNLVGPRELNFYQRISSAFGNENINWNVHESSSFRLFDEEGTVGHDLLFGSEKDYAVVFSANVTRSLKDSRHFIYQDQERSYGVEKRTTWYSMEVIESFRIPGKVELVGARKRPAAPVTLAGAPFVPVVAEPLHLANLSATDNEQTIADGNFSVTDGLHFRAIHALAAREVSHHRSHEANTGWQGEQNYFTPLSETKQRWQFTPFFHPYVCKFMEELNRGGIDGLLRLANQQLHDVGLVRNVMANFELIYRPNKDNVASPYPIEIVDFSSSGAYSLYNWELFFHVPMLLANRLSKNQRFEESMRWYHFVFNPTTNDDGRSSTRFWQVFPLLNTKEETLDALMKQLHLPPGNPKRKELEDAITAWRRHPFNPHLIARMRLIAYQKNTVMKYLDNLIAWADYLFRQDTIESINQATQLYILAAELCGKRPQNIPALGQREALSYDELEKKGLDAFSNAEVLIETTFPFFRYVPAKAGGSESSVVLNTTIPAFYFCLPNNEKLLTYWDTIADRLFKIRHCQNIEGVERQLALFEPAIDPALLVRATAGGVDISSVLADLNSPKPYYRFSYVAQKALEMCGELRALGNSLLSALEKKDGEALALMRGQHDTMLLNLAKTVRALQVTESQRTREGLELTREVTKTGVDYYGQLIRTDLIDEEKEHTKKLETAKDRQDDASYVEIAASIAHAAPTFSGPVFSFSLGGSNVGSSLNAWTRFINYVAAGYTYEANKSSINASNKRRSDDWQYQHTRASKELAQIDKQILAAQIREQIAGKEIINNEQQIDNARQVEEFLRNKYTQEELYGWTIGELSTIYFQCYQLAYDLAKKAEKCYRFELGLPDSNFIQFGMWDSFRKGLLSGERLYLSLKQMEKSYMDQNRREYEITKQVSLVQLDPLALITLKETGTCLLELPEMLFDFDFPGHYMRRIKGVSLSIPCVTGPYSSVNCTLTLLKSRTRVRAKAGTYAEDMDSENSNVVTNFSASESIATSTAQNDSGLFEFNFRDERYLPFEGSGALSTWRIELPKDFHQFDYATISDVVLHLRYTARAGGDSLRKAAVDNLTKKIAAAEAAGSVRLFSIRHEFPTEWAKFQSHTPAVNQRFELAITLRPEHYPFWSQGRLNSIKVLDIVARSTQKPMPGRMDIFDKADKSDGAKKGTLVKDAALGGLLHGQLTAGLPAKPDGELKLFVETKALADVWVAVTWGA